MSNASKYAIRAVIFLAENSSKYNKYGSVEIAEALQIPNSFIAKLLQQLAKEEVISSTKGPNGGFYLSEDNLQRKVCDILEVIENKKVFDSCFLGLPYCSEENPCPMHDIFSTFKTEILERFERQTISELTKDIREKGTFISRKESFL